MRYSAAVSALALATTAVLAQDPITVSMSTGNPASLIIHVGNDGNGTKKFAFTPNSVNAPNGTVITFVFDTPGTNHTVAQSTFQKPCEPGPGGFDSGYTTGPANAGDPPATWNLTITNDAKPIWFYCAQAATTPVHCTAGMVGAINAPASPAPNDFDAFASAAMAAPTVSQPTPALSGAGAFASAAPTILVSGTSATNSAATTTDSASSSSSATDSSSAATDSATSSTDAPPTTQATDTTSATSAPPTNTNGGAVTTMTVSSTSSSSTASSTNAGVRGVGTNGLVWAVAAVFGAALL
ncbi:hypothetical protein V8D89_001700 [Ganoderma adspersum]